MTKVELYKSRIFVSIIHLFALGQTLYALCFDKFEIQRSVKLNNSPSRRLVPDDFANASYLLSYWCLIVQALYYIISIINDFIGTNEVAPKHTPGVRKSKDYIIASLAFPLAFNVGITFWSLYAIDRELVFPKVLDAVFPSWLNHILHTNIMVFIVLEMFITFRAYPRRSAGLTGLGLFMVAYLIWIHIVKEASGVWVYPVLEVLSLPQRIVFFAASIAFTFSLYLFGEWLNSTVWAKELKMAQRKVK